MTYIAIAIISFLVEGRAARSGDPNRPSTRAIGAENMIGNIPGFEVHWGLVVAVMLGVLLFVLIQRTTFGFAVRVTGGSTRAALAQGLPVGKLIVACCRWRAPAPGSPGSSRSPLSTARPMPRCAPVTASPASWWRSWHARIRLTIIPVALLFGGIAAAGGLIQRRMDLPDATVLLLQGLVFVVLLASETLYGRLRVFNPVVQTDRT